MAAFLSRNENKSVYGKTEEEKIVLELRKLLNAMRTEEANKAAAAAKAAAPWDQAEEERVARETAEDTAEADDPEADREAAQEQAEETVSDMEKALGDINKFVAQRKSRSYGACMQFEPGRDAVLHMLMFPAHFRVSHLCRLSFFTKFMTPEGGVSSTVINIHRISTNDTKQMLLEIMRMMFENMCNIASPKPFKSRQDLAKYSAKPEDIFWQEAAEEFDSGTWQDAEKVSHGELMEEMDRTITSLFVDKSVPLTPMQGFGNRKNKVYMERLTDQYQKILLMQAWSHKFGGTLSEAALRKRRELMVSRIEYLFSFARTRHYPLPLFTVKAIECFELVLKKVSHSMKEVSNLIHSTLQTHLACPFLHMRKRA